LIKNQNLSIIFIFTKFKNIRKSEKFQKNSKSYLKST